jgi:cell division protein FtsI (penicillin-binding protein 3)
VFANHGIKRPVSIVRLKDKVPGDRVLPASVATQMVSMLKTVTEKGGTGTRAQIAGYQVAGKTGTAHKTGAGGYADSKYTAVFAGFAPADDPDLVAVVVIDEPSGSEYYGGEVAAPLFSAVVSSALHIRNIVPEYEYSTKTGLAVLQ